MKAVVLTRAELLAWARRLRADRDRAEAELTHVEALLSLRAKAGHIRPPKQRARPESEDTKVTQPVIQQDEREGQSLKAAVQETLTTKWQSASAILTDVKRTTPDARMSSVSTALIRLVKKGLAERRGEPKHYQFRKLVSEVQP